MNKPSIRIIAVLLSAALSTGYGTPQAGFCVLRSWDSGSTGKTLFSAEALSIESACSPRHDNKTSQALSRKITRRRAALVASGLSVAAVLGYLFGPFLPSVHAQNRPATVPSNPVTEIMEVAGQRMIATQHQKIADWQKGDFRSGEIAQVARILIRHREYEMGEAPKIGLTDDESDFQSPKIRRLLSDQAQVWKDLQAIAQSDELKKAVGPDFSRERFDDFILQFLPSYAARFGLFVYHDVGTMVDNKGTPTIFHAFFIPDFYVIEEIEQPDFGPELGPTLERLGAHITQRLILGGVLDGDLTEKPDARPWAGKRFYQTLEFKRSSLEKETGDVVLGVRSLRESARVGPGGLVALRSKMTLPRSLRNVLDGRNPWVEGLSNVLVEFYIKVDQLMASAEAQNQDPLPLITQRIKRIYDLHEGSHELDEFDPHQYLNATYAHWHGNTVKGYLAANQDHLLHGEINASLGELRYGDPLWVLGLWTLKSVINLTDPRPLEGYLSTPEHEWIMQKAATFLEEGRASKFDMKIQDNFVVSQRNQVIVQLARLVDPRYASQTRALADQIKSEHQTQYVPSTPLWIALSEVLGGLAAMAAIGVWLFKMIRKTGGPQSRTRRNIIGMIASGSALHTFNRLVGRAG